MRQPAIRSWFKRAQPRVSAAALLLALAASAGAQQDFPSRPITFIYPAPAGSIGDVVLRIMADEASKILGQPVVMEFRPGVAGRLGMNALLTSRGQGHIISMAPNTLLVAEPLRDPKYDIQPGRDYTPIILAFVGPFVLAVHPSVPFRDLAGMVAYSKANRGKLNFAAGSPGSTGSIAAILINEQLGTDLTTISYKGTPGIQQAILSGEAHVTLTTASIKPFIDSGKVVALAVTTAKRMVQLPNVPTVTEIGLPFLSRTGAWVSIIGAADVPKEITAKLNRVFNETLKLPQVQKRLVEEAGYEIGGGSPEELTELIRTDLEKMRPIFQKLKLD